MGGMGGDAPSFLSGWIDSVLRKTNERQSAATGTDNVHSPFKKENPHRHPCHPCHPLLGLTISRLLRPAAGPQTGASCDDLGVKLLVPPLRAQATGVFPYGALGDANGIRVSLGGVTEPQ